MKANPESKQNTLSKRVTAKIVKQKVPINQHYQQKTKSSSAVNQKSSFEHLILRKINAKVNWLLQQCRTDDSNHKQVSHTDNSDICDNSQWKFLNQLHKENICLKKDNSRLHQVVKTQQRQLKNQINHLRAGIQNNFHAITVEKATIFTQTQSKIQSQPKLSLNSAQGDEQLYEQARLVMAAEIQKLKQSLAKAKQQIQCLQVLKHKGKPTMNDEAVQTEVQFVEEQKYAKQMLKEVSTNNLQQQLQQKKADCQALIKTQEFYRQEIAQIKSKLFECNVQRMQKFEQQIQVVIKQRDYLNSIIHNHNKQMGQELQHLATRLQTHEQQIVSHHQQQINIPMMLECRSQYDCMKVCILRSAQKLQKLQQLMLHDYSSF